MPVVTVVVSQFAFETVNGHYLKNIILRTTGIPANGNTSVAHGLVDASGNGATPIQVGFEPKSNSVFWEYQAADTTNIYVGVGAASGTHALDIYLTY